jgi:glucose-6-phosphate isomerase
MDRVELWNRYRRHLCVVRELGLKLDVSRMHFSDDDLSRLSAPMASALEAMRRLEAGELANADEQRMVGHYWLRAPERAPSEDIRREIKTTVDDIRSFASDVHEGRVRPEKGDGFYVVLVIGIGGSALGPQLLADALGSPDDPVMLRFLDNTDPDGIDRTFDELGEAIENTLCVVISKSGGTKETRNGMIEAGERYRRAGLDFARHAVAITGAGSALDAQARSEGWLRVFPLWDWVGGRTSVTSAVGLLPAALQGVDIESFLHGARDGDEATRVADLRANPAALMAAMWHCAGGGRGTRDMVVLPYSDRLALFGRYLQQLVMESLGKHTDRQGRVVEQGLTVYGNKGSTDQHAYVQQLRDGGDNFFVTFIEVLRNRPGHSIEVEEGITTGDYLFGLLHGTREALTERGRQSMTLTIERVTPRTLGALIALFERAVGLYAELIDVNAYHQPGVEAGKKAAGAILDLQRRVREYIADAGGRRPTPEEIAAAIGQPDSVETIHHVLEHLAANG